MCREGFAWKVCATLLSSGILPESESTTAELRKLHPRAPAPMCPLLSSLPAADEVSLETVDKVLKSLPLDSALGHQHFVFNTSWKPLALPLGHQSWNKSQHSPTHSRRAPHHQKLHLCSLGLVSWLSQNQKEESAQSRLEKCSGESSVSAYAARSSSLPCPTSHRCSLE